MFRDSDPKFLLLHVFIRSMSEHIQDPCLAHLKSEDLETLARKLTIFLHCPEGPKQLSSLPGSPWLILMSGVMTRCSQPRWTGCDASQYTSLHLYYSPSSDCRTNHQASPYQIYLFHQTLRSSAHQCILPCFWHQGNALAAPRWQQAQWDWAFPCWRSRMSFPQIQPFMDSSSSTLNLCPCNGSAIQTHWHIGHTLQLSKHSLLSKLYCTPHCGWLQETHFWGGILESTLAASGCCLSTSALTWTPGLCAMPCI